MTGRRSCPGSGVPVGNITYVSHGPGDRNQDREGSGSEDSHLPGVSKTT